MQLKDFLEISGDNAVRVCVKEPNECAKYWTTLRNGKSNIHTDTDLWREVYSIGVTYDESLGNILSVHIW